MKTDPYTYRVTWPAEDKEHAGLCVEFRLCPGWLKRLKQRSPAFANW